MHIYSLEAVEKEREMPQSLDQAVLLLFSELKEEGKTTLNWLDIQADGKEVSYDIYRHRSKINNKQALKKAEYLDTVPAGVMQYEDFLSKKGKYHYGVFAVINKVEKHVFIDGHSTTGEFPVINKDEYRGETVRLVRARPRKDGSKIDLHWVDIKQREGVEYLVYKASFLLNTLDLASQARQLASVKMDTMVYVDELEGNEGAYYAIAVKKDGKFVKSAFGEDSYSKIPIKNKRFIKPRMIFESLKGEFDKVYSNLIISWEIKHLDDDFETSLYWSTKPIDSTGVLKKAKRLTMIDSQKKSFLHTNINPLTKNYYAIGVKSKSLKTYLKLFDPSRNYTEKPLIKYPIARRLKAIFLKDKRVVQLEWSLEKEIKLPLEVLIYRFEKKIDPKTLLWGEMIKQKPLVQTNLKRYQTEEIYTFYDDKLKEETTYQYVVLLQLLNSPLSELSQEAKQTKLFTVPLIFAENVSENLVETGSFKIAMKEIKGFFSNDLKAIINRYFYKGKYYLAEHAFQSFLKEGKAKTMNEKKYVYLYLGRTSFELGNKKQALYYFKLLKKIDEELGLFWLRFII